MYRTSTRTVILHTMIRSTVPRGRAHKSSKARTEQEVIVIVYYLGIMLIYLQAQEHFLVQPVIVFLIGYFNGRSRIFQVPYDFFFELTKYAYSSGGSSRGH